MNHLPPTAEELHALVDGELDATRKVEIRHWAEASKANAEYLQGQMQAIQSLKTELAALGSTSRLAPSEGLQALLTELDPEAGAVTTIEPEVSCNVTGNITGKT